MAATLGKRKRRDAAAKRHPPTDDTGSEDEDDMRLRFQRAFEGKFKPLPKPPVKETVEKFEEDEDSIDDESDWSGLSGNGSESDDEIETVEHTTTKLPNTHQDRWEIKTFMSSKPPSSPMPTKQTRIKSVATSAEDSAEADNMQNDLALQRLLKESHLLDAQSIQNSSTAPEGKKRIKALDLRLQHLGAKESHLRQEKMPMSHRKGMTAKATAREDKRRKEAAENGIILERIKSDVQPKLQRRERGVGGANVGKFKGGMLKLSSRDLRDIQGSGAGTGRSKMRRKR